MPRPPSVRAIGSGRLIVKIKGFGNQPGGWPNESFRVKQVDANLNEIGEEFDVYARIKTDPDDPIYDLRFCTPACNVGDYLEIRRTHFPMWVGPETQQMLKGWFAEGTFQSIGCTT